MMIDGRLYGRVTPERFAVCQSWKAMTVTVTFRHAGYRSVGGCSHENTQHAAANTRVAAAKWPARIVA
jgi:hypothetical protein